MAPYHHIAGSGTAVRTLRGRPATTGTDVLTWTTVTCAPNALVATVVGVTLPDCWSYEAAGALVT